MFYGCTGLENVNLHSGITAIGSSAFIWMFVVEDRKATGITAIKQQHVQPLFVTVVNQYTRMPAALIDENAFPPVYIPHRAFIPKNVAR